MVGTWVQKQAGAILSNFFKVACYTLLGSWYIIGEFFAYISEVFTKLICNLFGLVVINGINCDVVYYARFVTKFSTDLINGLPQFPSVILKVLTNIQVVTSCSISSNLLISC